MSNIIKALGPLARLPVPIFGTLNLAVNFAVFQSGAVQRLAPWGASLGLFGTWFVYPALTQDFKAGLGFGITKDEEAALLQKEKDSVKDVTKADYSALGSIQTHATRVGVKRAEFEADEIDQMPRNTSEEAAEAVAQAVKLHAKGHRPSADDNMASKSVDSLRRFSTRAGVSHEWVEEEIDVMPSRIEADEEEDMEDDEDDEDEE